MEAYYKYSVNSTSQMYYYLNNFDNILVSGGIVYYRNNLEVCQGLATSRWFSPGTLVSSTYKADRHDITEILLKVASNPYPNPEII